MWQMSGVVVNDVPSWTKLGKTKNEIEIHGKKLFFSQNFIPSDKMRLPKKKSLNDAIKKQQLPIFVRDRFCIFFITFSYEYRLEHSTKMLKRCFFLLPLKRNRSRQNKIMLWKLLHLKNLYEFFFGCGTRCW